MTTTADHNPGEHNHPLQVFNLDHDCSTVVFAKVENNREEQGGGSDSDYRVYMDMDFLLSSLVEGVQKMEMFAFLDPSLTDAIETLKTYGTTILDIRDHHLAAIEAQEAMASVNDLGDIPDWQ